MMEPSLIVAGIGWGESCRLPHQGLLGQEGEHPCLPPLGQPTGLLLVLLLYRKPGLGNRFQA